MLFNTFIRENSELWNDDFKEEFYSVCCSIVGLEDEFIKLASALGDVCHSIPVTAVFLDLSNGAF